MLKIWKIKNFKDYIGNRHAGRVLKITTRQDKNILECNFFEENFVFTIYLLHFYFCKVSIQVYNV